MSDVVQRVELRGVYDGWSVEVYADGSMRNRWADENGAPRPGHERRWAATQEWIEREAK